MSRAATSPEDALIQIAAGTRERRARSRGHARGLAAALDWEALEKELTRRRLMPQLGERIAELAAERTPARYLRALEQAKAMTLQQGTMLALLAKRMTDDLEQAGIPSLILKGPVLGERIYGDLGHRLAGDVDLLVAAEHLPATVALAARAGYFYEPGHDHVGPGGLPLLHHTLRHRENALPPLELHWRVHWYEQDFAREMLARSIAGGPYGRTPLPADELACLLLFYARDGFIDLRLACDLAAWWDGFGSDAAGGALSGVLERHPALARALVAAAIAAERTVGVPAAALVGEDRLRLGGRARLASRLANPDSRGSSEQLYADMGLVDWLLTPKGGQRAFVLRQLLPPREVLEERARAGVQRRVTRGGHCVRILGRCGLALPRLICSPS